MYVGAVRRISVHLSWKYPPGQAAAFEPGETLADSVELGDGGTAARQLPYGGRLGRQGEAGPRPGQQRGPASRHQYEDKVFSLKARDAMHNGLGRLQTVIPKTNIFLCQLAEFFFLIRNTVPQKTRNKELSVFSYPCRNCRSVSGVLL